jgi:hypothetical protein
MLSQHRKLNNNKQLLLLNNVNNNRRVQWLLLSKCNKLLQLLKLQA